MFWQLLLRLGRRTLEIPHRGFPSFHGNPCSFDRDWGVETSSIVWLTNPTSSHFGHGVRYEGCDPHACRWAIETANVDLSRFYFVDVGCGKGRPLLIASRYDFAHLVGIDYSRKLCLLADRNMRKCDVPREKFEIVCKDAVEFKFPQHDLFVYFYNPFDGEILDAVLSNLQAATLENKVFVAFEGKNRDLLMSYHWLSKIANGPNIVLHSSVTNRA